MNKVFKMVAGILVFSILLQFSAFAVDDNFPEPETSDWIKWELPKENIAMNSAIDVSFLLDKPAGKHGFASPQGEDIIFDDGTKFAIWGTTIAMDSAFPTHERAEELADRVARSGYNLVRFHHLDISGMSNIFSSNPNADSTLSLDPVQMEKFFYLLNCLKERGIYYYIDLLVSRGVYEKDGIINATEVKNAYNNSWGVLRFFDTKMIELQKEYARQLLTTKNPYTGKSLAEDPAMVLVDITNEASMLSFDTSNMPEYYYNKLNALYNDYLIQKYKTTSALKTAWRDWTDWNKIVLNDGESLEEKTVSLGRCQLVDGYAALRYSEKRTQTTFEFLYDTLKAYYIDMKSFLNNTLGVKCLITSTGLGGSTGAFRPATTYMNKEIMDYTDLHAYMSHPDDFGHTEGSTAWITSNLLNPYIFYMYEQARVYNQPFVLGEWDECSINDRRAEMGVMIPVLSRFLNWNPIHFCLTGSVEREMGKDYIVDAFSYYSDPAYTNLEPLSAAIYHTGSDLAANNVYYVPRDKDYALDYKNDNFTSSWNFMLGKTGTMYTDFSDYDASLTNKTSFESNAHNADNSGWLLQNKIYYKTPELAVSNEYVNAFAYVAPYTTEETVSKKVKISKDLPYFKFDGEGDFCVVGVNSVTKSNLDDTNRILLTAQGKSRNTGFKLDGGTIVDAGVSPALIEGVDADITIKSQDAIKVYALDTSGRRVEEVPTEKIENGYSRFAINKKYNTCQYEIVKSNNVSNNLISFGVVINHGDNTFDVTGNIESASVSNSLNVTLSEKGKSDIGDAIYNGVVAVDDKGNFATSIPFGNDFKPGEYEIRVWEEGSLPTTIYFDYYMENYGIKVDVAQDDNTIKINGNLLNGKLAVKNARISIYVTKSSRIFDPATEITLENMNQALYYVDQSASGENGDYNFNVKMDGAAGGTYCVVVGANIDGVKVASRFEYSFDGTPMDYTLSFFDSVEKKNEVVMLANADTVTAIAQPKEGIQSKGTLIFALYKDDKLVDAKMNSTQKNSDGELYITYSLPENKSGYKVKAFLFENLTSITPLSEASELE